jgi:hypothetical protein
MARVEFCPITVGAGAKLDYYLYCATCSSTRLSAMETINNYDMKPTPSSISTLFNEADIGRPRQITTQRIHSPKAENSLSKSGELSPGDAITPKNCLKSTPYARTSILNAIQSIQVVLQRY